MCRKIILFLSLVVCAKVTFAQELDFTVTINADQIQTNDRAIFKDMEESFTNFLNVRRWTNNSYKNYEKIKGTIFLNITSQPSIGNFIASAQITSARPVYNTSYETVLLNFADRNWTFQYTESLPLEYNDNTYTANLTSLLAFYAYIIIGTDYDSFSEMGGDFYFQKALTVVNNAQSSGNPGWESLTNNRNRYSLIENLNNSQMIELRRNTYRYHRLGLDIFEENPVQSREVILNGLREIKDIWNIYPNAILIISFFDAKSKELVNIFSKGTLPVKREAYELLSAMDPRREIYKKIMTD